MEPLLYWRFNFPMQIVFLRPCIHVALQNCCFVLQTELILVGEESEIQDSILRIGTSILAMKILYFWAGICFHHFEILISHWRNIFIQSRICEMGKILFIGTIVSWPCSHYPWTGQIILKKGWNLLFAIIFWPFQSIPPQRCVFQCLTFENHLIFL